MVWAIFGDWRRRVTSPLQNSSSGDLPIGEEQSSAGDAYDREAARQVNELFRGLALPEVLGNSKLALARIFERQLADGLRKSADPYWSTRGDYGVQCNVGDDVITATYVALGEIKRLSRARDWQHSKTTSGALSVLASNIWRIRGERDKSAPDPDGFAAATMGEIVRDLYRLALDIDPTFDQNEGG